MFVNVHLTESLYAYNCACACACACGYVASEGQLAEPFHFKKGSSFSFRSSNNHSREINITEVPVVVQCKYLVTFEIVDEIPIIS